MQNSSKNWYIIYTRPKWEKKVAEQLARKKINSYCPLNSMARDWSERRKPLTEPLFSSYVFVNLNETELGKVRQTDGVINFVHWLGSPAVVRTEEIETVKNFINDYPEVRVEKIHVNLSDHVRIVSEPLMKREGNLLEIRNNVVKAVLPSLGYMLVAELNNESEEKIGYLRSMEEIIK